MVSGADDPTSIGFFGGTATFGPEWRRFDLPIREYSRFPNARFSIRIGGEARTLELGGLEAINYGSAVLPHQLPYKRVSYDGREANASWRKDAADRIEKYRKGDFSKAARLQLRAA